MKIAKWLGVAALIAFILASIYLVFFRPQQLPSAFILGRCGSTKDSPRRIDSWPVDQRVHVIFDLPEDDLTVLHGVDDMPPRTVYVVSVNGNDSSLEIVEDGDVSFENQLTQGFYVMSRRVRDGRVRTSQGLDIGEDRWGYIAESKKWRLISLAWGTKIGYPPTLTKYADMFDRVIASACFLPQS